MEKQSEINHYQRKNKHKIEQENHEKFIAECIYGAVLFVIVFSTIAVAVHQL